MSLGKQLEDAAKRLEDATLHIEAAREKPVTLGNLAEWLAALTEFALAESDIQRLNNQSIHAKLHAIAGRLGVDDVL